ncbi:MAG: DUF1573 domain-containing protein [Thermoguttaceae bacterium]|nr:DUF1573 domain-containing protein [Thermoguttaceae bacterium]
MRSWLKNGSFFLWFGAAAAIAVAASFFLPRGKAPEFGDFPERGVYMHHLGTLWFDPNDIKTITDEFTVVNPLNEKLSLSIGAKTCSCVATDFTDRELPPHETAIVKLTMTPSTNSAFRREGITLNTGNKTLPAISLTTFAETLPYYSISLSDNTIYDLRDGEERTIPFSAAVYAPDPEDDSIALFCDDGYVTVREKSRTTRKRSDELYETDIAGEITVRCDLSKVRPPVVHNTVCLEYKGEIRFRKDVIWCPKPSCSVSKDTLFFNTASLVPQTVEVGTDKPSSVTRLVAKDSFLELTEPDRKTGQAHTVNVSLLPERLPEGAGNNIDSEIAIYLDEPEKPAAVIPVKIYLPERAESE